MLDHITLRDVLYGSIVSKRENYCYIPVGKAANTNVKRLFWQIEHQRLHPYPLGKDYFCVHNYEWRFAKAESKEPWVRFKQTAIHKFYNELTGRALFTVVRNPYVRLLSGYLEKIHSKQTTNPDIYKRFMLPRLPKDFSEFIQMVCDQPDQKVNIHFRLQSYATLFDYLPYTTVGHVEDLKASFQKFSMLAFNKDYSHLLKAKADHAQNANDQIMTYYKPALIDAVNRRFKEDFINFGYAFDPNHLGPQNPLRPPGLFQDKLKQSVTFSSAFIRIMMHDLTEADAVYDMAQSYLAEVDNEPLVGYSNPCAYEYAKRVSLKLKPVLFGQA